MCARVVVRASNLKISRRCLPDNLCLIACYSTIVLLFQPIVSLTPFTYNTLITRLSQDTSANCRRRENSSDSHPYTMHCAIAWLIKSLSKHDLDGSDNVI